MSYHELIRLVKEHWLQSPDSKTSTGLMDIYIKVRVLADEIVQRLDDADFCAIALLTGALDIEYNPKDWVKSNESITARDLVKRSITADVAFCIADGYKKEGKA